MTFVSFANDFVLFEHPAILHKLQKLQMQMNKLREEGTFIFYSTTLKFVF